MLQSKAMNNCWKPQRRFQKPVWEFCAEAHSNPEPGPYNFEGLGKKGLKILKRTSEKFDMAVVTEVMEIGQIELIAHYSDIFARSGTRNIQEFQSAKSGWENEKTGFAKRVMSATIKEIFASRRIHSVKRKSERGLCERGIQDI